MSILGKNDYHKLLYFHTGVFLLTLDCFLHDVYSGFTP